MSDSIEFEREEDGRWIAEIPELPGVMVYGASQEEARERVASLANRVFLSEKPMAAYPDPTDDEAWKQRFSALEAAREEIRKHLTPGRNYVQEFLDERRLEAERE